MTVYSDWTLTLTPKVNRIPPSTSGAVIPKDWSAEGALDTSLTSAGVSVQRTGYIQTYNPDTVKVQATCVCNDQGTGDTAATGLNITDEPQTINGTGRLAYQGSIIA